MPRGTPEEAFSEAGAAMRRGDWHGFFACVDRDSLLTIAENGVGRYMAAADMTSFSAICTAHGVADSAATLRSLAARITESAQASLSRPRDPATMVADSIRHKAVVDEYRAALKNIAKLVPNLHGFTADLEIALRQDSGSGSVSPKLFVDEVLETVTTDGRRARGVRRLAGGTTEEVGFVRRGEGWFIKPFTKGKAK